MLHDTYRTTGGSSAIDGRPYGRRLDTIANANGYENGCFREVYGKLPNIEWLYQQAMYIDRECYSVSQRSDVCLSTCEGIARCRIPVRLLAGWAAGRRN